MADPSKPDDTSPSEEEIREPTDQELFTFMGQNQRRTYEMSDMRPEQRKQFWDAHVRDWKNAQRRERERIRQEAKQSESPQPPRAEPEVPKPSFTPARIEIVQRMLNLSEADARQFLETATNFASQSPSEDEPTDGVFQDIEPSRTSPHPTPPGEFDDVRPIGTHAPEGSESTSVDDPQTKPTGISVPGQTRGRTAQEEYVDELRRFMPEQIRAEYENADSERREMLWDANERAFNEAERRKQQRLLAEEELTAHALDMLQRIKEDPSKAHLLPPADASLADLHKWYEEMSKPQDRPDYGNPPESEMGLNFVRNSRTKEVGPRATPGIRSGPKPLYPHGNPAGPFSRSSSDQSKPKSPKPPPDGPTHTEPKDPSRHPVLASVFAVLGTLILNELHVPLWLTLPLWIVLGLCIWQWPRIAKTKERLIFFWSGVAIYGLVILIVVIGAQLPKPRREETATLKTSAPSQIPAKTTSEGNQRAVAILPRYEITTLPISIAINETGYFLPLNPVFTEGFASLGNFTTKSMWWPAEKGELKKGGYAIEMASRCELKNYSETALLNLVMNYEISFYEGTSNQGKLISHHTHQVGIPALEQGKPFVFYIVNQSPYYAEVDFPKEAELQVAGESNRRTVSLVQPAESIDQLLQNFPKGTYGPSKIDWRRF
ncbi:MAG TPA: hypothetical protein VMZ30_01665 [Pyrinomonadaceae bacterium]|nr:hypothetical protein [Pyrinomonadaceae bacterium]